MKLKLHRDKVVSLTDKGERVGVYVLTPRDIIGEDEDDILCPKGTEILLAELEPEKADEIIAAWNGL